MATKVPNQNFTSKQCKNCGEVEPVTRGEINDVHGYKLRCPHCGLFVGWGGMTKEVKNKDGRQRSSNWTAKRLNYDYCQICRRHKDHLGHGERLEVHHVMSVENGGEDTPENIWVLCTACHRTVHYQQTYLHRHMEKYLSAFEALEKFKHDNPELYKRVRGKYPELKN
jgi:5-methylcytosine-specific restriction endonuclease McrA